VEELGGWCETTCVRVGVNPKFAQPFFGGGNLGELSPGDRGRADARKGSVDLIPGFDHVSGSGDAGGDVIVVSGHRFNPRRIGVVTLGRELQLIHDFWDDRHNLPILIVIFFRFVSVEYDPVLAEEIQ
jgi:hypothetical protein